MQAGCVEVQKQSSCWLVRPPSLACLRYLVQGFQPAHSTFLQSTAARAAVQASKHLKFDDSYLLAASPPLECACILSHCINAKACFGRASPLACVWHWHACCNSQQQLRAAAVIS